MSSDRTAAGAARAPEPRPGRDRAIARSAAAGALMQGVIVLSALVSLPFVARGLTTAEFGVLTTLTGLLGLFAFADLGIGSALTTRVAHWEALEDRDAVRRAISTAAAGVAAASLVVFIGIAGSAFIMPWERLLGAQDLSAGDVRRAVLATGAAIALGVVGSLGHRVLYGLHQGGRANVWLVAGAALSGVLTISAATSGAGLVTLVVTSLVVPAMVSITCMAWTLGKGAEHLRPRWSQVTSTEMHWLRDQSGWFFVIAVAGAAAFQTDAFIVAGVLGASSAAVYGVAARIFGLVSQGLHPGLLQLWPAFTDAYARGDLAWIRSRVVRAVFLVGGVASVAGGVLIVIGGDLVAWWLGAALAPPRPLLVAFMLWTAYSLMSAVVYVLFNAVGLVRVHAWVAVCAALVNLPVSLLLTRLLGVSGPVWGSLVASLACGVVPAAVMVPRVLRGEVSVSRASGAAEGDPRTASD